MAGALSLEEELASWCQSYVDAFSAYDVAGISAHWSFPALILQKGRSISFPSESVFARNTEALLGFYKRQGVARAERALACCLSMSIDVAAMRVRDRMLDVRGDDIVSWEASYVLQRVDGVWRAVCAAADGETDAWRARGTPLGS